MNIVVLNKTYTTTIPVKAGSSKNTLYFPTINVLNETFTTSIETFIPEVLTVSENNAPLASSALLEVSFLNLMVGDIRWIWNLPLLKIVNLNNQFSTGVASSLFQIELDNLQIIWDKSYIYIADISKIDPAIDQEYQFNISYNPPVKKE